ncbi:MAG: amino acid adenylation domain-containing protein, partial [Aquificales bacterium]|nr:amino acid adenylation domain-containing protein [Aquificales bacterium]
KVSNVKLALRDIFEQSTIAQIADLITNVQTKTSLSAIPLADTTQPIPVSFAQQRLLIIDQLAPNQATYNIPLALRLDGNLDENALQTAVNTLYTRHGSLRTTFRYAENGQPYQQITNTNELPITRVDFSQLPEEEREQKALARVQEEVQRPFSLTQEPLIRINHIQLAEKQHILIIVMHHIITDGWSMNIFMREMLRLYIASQQNVSLQLPELHIQYTDFAVWQRDWMSGDVLTQQLAYWENNLADAPEIITLPTDMPRPKLQSTRGAAYTKMLPTDLTQPLTQISQTHNSSLFMTLLAAYNILLARYSQQDDIIVGTPIANRNHPDIENLIGFFVNMLPLRTKIGENDSFTTLLDHVRQTALNAYNHQDIPFEQLVDALQPPRDTSHFPLFQVVFSLQNAAAPLTQPNDVTLTPLTAESKTSKYDLTLTVTETNNGLSCTWEYNTDLFLPETITRMHTHFDTLLHGIINDPERAVADLTLLSETERETILQTWQGADDPDVPQICLHECFEEWVEQQPQVTAVTDQNATLSYDALNKQANQLARLLIQQGVQPGDAVGIHMSASVPAIVSIIACHKARAAYVPFNPAYPAQRLQLMVDDTSAPVILTDTNLDHLETTTYTIWQWEAVQAKLAEQANTNLNLACTPTDPAYIIYTSGSTGKPKGIVCGHTGVFNLKRSFDQWGALPPQNISALWTSLAFDVSVYEIFSAFISGGSLHIVPAEIRPDTSRLFTWMAQHNIQNAYLPPFMAEPFHQWLQDEAHTSSLQHLLVGVEPLAEQTLAAIQGSIPGLILINAYGPTEATICATSYRVLAESTRTGNAPIGRPLHNSQVYLLGDRMKPVPVGVTGELFIGGIGLAHGYLNRPELTAERFVSDPFSTEPEARLYRTGDLAKYLPDGNIQFIGRTDFQLKVRGFRVELGEIESHLLAQPGVAASVIMPQTATDGQILLVAYFVAEEGVSLNQQDLHDALNKALPNYMVPAVWVALDEMPRTPNDKIDRKALPLPNLETLERTTPFVSPQNPIEMELYAIWQTLLKVSDISIHDNFFELGGHS